MDFSSIKEYLKPDLDRVQDLMNTSLASDIELLDKTNQRVLAHSGKQVRPVLALLTAKACSGGFVTEETIHFAAAAELIHNATLLHDDVADNSPVRRTYRHVPARRTRIRTIGRLLAGKRHRKRTFREYIFRKSHPDFLQHTVRFSRRRTLAVTESRHLRYY